MAAHEDRGPQLIGVNTLFLTLAVIATVMRCYVRLFMVKAFGTDDYLMLAATASFIVYISLSLSGVAHGTGQHHAELPPEQITVAISYWWACQLFYAVTMIVSKISIGVFLARVTVQRLHTWIIWGAVLISIVAGGAFFFVVLFQCQPISEYWMRYGRGVVGPVDNGSGRCLNVEIIIALAYLYSACSIVADFTLALLPAWIISSLKMDRKSKMLLIPLVGMGTIASAGLVVRSPYLLTFRDGDFLWATVDIAIWSTVEQGLAITAGSLATTRPLLRAFSQRMGWGTSARKSTNDQLGYSGTGAFPGGSGNHHLGPKSKTGNKSQMGTETFALSSRRTQHKDSGGSWDGLDSDPEDGHRGFGATAGAVASPRAERSERPMTSSGRKSESRSRPSLSGARPIMPPNGPRKLQKSPSNESEEELQSSGLSSENVVVTRSFLVTDERV